MGAPAGLFRDLVAPSSRRGRWPYRVAALAAFVAIAGLSVWLSPYPEFNLGFLAGMAAVLVFLRVAGGLICRLIAGLPRTIPITSTEVMEAIEVPLQQLVAAVRTVLEQTPPELSSDIIDRGMVMSGGGSLLRNIDKLLTQVTGVPCHVAENSLNCVALGTGLALEHFDFFKKSLVQQI